MGAKNWSAGRGLEEKARGLRRIARPGRRWIARTRISSPSRVALLGEREEALAEREKRLEERKEKAESRKQKAENELGEAARVAEAQVVALAAELEAARQGWTAQKEKLEQEHARTSELDCLHTEWEGAKEILQSQVVALEAEVQRRGETIEDLQTRPAEANTSSEEIEKAIESKRALFRKSRRRSWKNELLTLEQEVAQQKGMIAAQRREVERRAGTGGKTRRVDGEGIGQEKRRRGWGGNSESGKAASRKPKVNWRKCVEVLSGAGRECAVKSRAAKRLSKMPQLAVRLKPAPRPRPSKK